MLMFANRIGVVERGCLWRQLLNRAKALSPGGSFSPGESRNWRVFGSFGSEARSR